MSMHAMQTAMALYEGGTLDLETAARQAGVDPERLARRARSYTVHDPEPSPRAERERPRVASD